MSRRLLTVVLVPIAAVAALSGCSVVRHTASGGPTGVVKGDVLAGPTCPVPSTDPSQCQDAPVEGSIEFWQGDTNTGAATIRVDGTFSVNVPVGDYTVKVRTKSTTGFHVCPDTTVNVIESGTHEVHVQCDTGIP